MPTWQQRTLRKLKRGAAPCTQSRTKRAGKHRNHDATHVAQDESSHTVAAAPSRTREQTGVFPPVAAWWVRQSAGQTASSAAVRTLLGGLAHHTHSTHSPSVTRRRPGEAHLWRWHGMCGGSHVAGMVVLVRWQDPTASGSGAIIHCRWRRVRVRRRRGKAGVQLGGSILQVDARSPSCGHRCPVRGWRAVDKPVGCRSLCNSAARLRAPHQCGCRTQNNAWQQVSGMRPVRHVR